MPTKRRKKGPGRRFPKGMEAQALVFDRNRFSAREARSWASAHGFKAPATERQATTLRLKQKPKGSFDERTFRMIPMRGGVQLVVAVPKRKMRRKRRG